MSLNLKSSGGGSVTVDVPSTASNYTATLPAGTGNVVVNGINGALVSGTAVASTSGTSIDFTGIPSWVKRITVILNEVSFAANTGVFRVRIGSGSLSTSGYTTVATSLPNAAGTTVATFTDGLAGSGVVNAGTGIYGIYTIVNLTGNTWVCSGTHGRNTDLASNIANGSIALSGTLDRLSVVATTSTFDAGSINIMYE